RPASSAGPVSGAARVVQAIDALAEAGPALGRLLVDTIAHSSIPNLKELVSKHGTDSLLFRSMRWGGGRSAMSGHIRWSDIRAEYVARAGGEEAVEAGKQELLAVVIGHRLAEVRRARGLTQQQVADRMGVTKGRVSQIEQGKVSGQDVLARFATALGGRPHPAIYFEDGNIAAIA